ncbi:unnamed protein product [Aureobasidium pullulans]|nr:unnamed protein product [Aureobasidium pullulans]
MGLRSRLAIPSASEHDYHDQISTNKEQQPVPLGSPERTWTWPSLLGFWVAEAFSISMYQGLNPGLSILAVLIGHFLLCIPAMLDGYIGAMFGINFPVFTRASFGMRGSYFAVFVRGVVACIWFGTQSFQGGQCLQVMIEAIWPSFERFPNRLPESAHVTSAQLLCFFLFILVQAPLLWLKVSSLRYMFMAKTIIMPIFGLTLFIWALVAAKGFGPTFSQPTRIKDGTPAAVVFLQCVTTAIGPKATLALNMPDFTRYAKYPKQVFWTQAYSAKSFSSFLGGYALFLGALVGIIITDFWICRRRSLDVRALYKKHDVHHFTAGFNIRAFIAFFCGIAPNMPGLAAACGASGVPNGARYLYSLSWLVSTLVAGLVYWVSFKIKPFEISPSQEMYMDGVEGYDPSISEIPQHTKQDKEVEA